VRSVSPVNRKSTAPVLNMHSVKNRFLMRINNLTPGIWRRFWLPMVWRDLLVVGGCLLVEPSSLPALWNFARCLPRARRRRRLIMSRRTVTDDVLAQWFSFRPVAYPIGTATPVMLPREFRAAASGASVLAP
jgi:hypothetical protein